MKGRARPSLRRQLMWLLTAAIMLVWLLSALVVYQRAHHEADELLDNQLTQIAETLLAFVAGGEIEHVIEVLHEHAGHNPVPIAFEIWYADDGGGARLAASPGHAAFERGLPDGFSERPYDGARWRFFATWSRDGHYRIAVGQPHAAREKLARDIGLSLLLPASLALPFVALTIWWVVRRALRPVNALAQQVGALDAHALAPLAADTPLPQEVAPLRDAINALIPRVAEAFDNERRFTADAAHELRTPLAALKIQAQVAARAETAEGRRHALGQVVAGVDRMSHLVEQLLTLARIDPARPLAPAAAFDPASQLAAWCGAFAERAARDGQQVRLTADPGCQLAVDPAWLAIAVRNLVDNALRYAGEGAHIEVCLQREARACRLSVADDGPGVPADLRSRLTARFQRGDTDTEGCGLGLSIVERIATLANARLEFGDGLTRPDGGRGFAATLWFPAAD